MHLASDALARNYKTPHIEKMFPGTARKKPFSLISCQ